MNKWLYGTRHLRLCYRIERERSAVAAGIFRMCLVLMAVVGVNRPLFSSEENGIAPENREEILQRMKEREVSLRMHQWRLEQEIAAQEARQKALERPALALERKIRRHMWKVLSLVIFALMKLCRQHLREVICQHSGERGDRHGGHGGPGKEWKEVAFHDKALNAAQGIYIPVDRTVGHLITCK